MTAGKAAAGGRLPEACLSMAEVREGVDALDRELVRLLAVRQRYMEAAARIKEHRDEVHDAERVEEVIAKVLEAAAREGLSRDIAEPVWRELVARSIAYELEVWDRTRK